MPQFPHLGAAWGRQRGLPSQWRLEVEQLPEFSWTPRLPHVMDPCLLHCSYSASVESKVCREEGTRSRPRRPRELSVTFMVRKAVHTLGHTHPHPEAALALTGHFSANVPSPGRLSLLFLGAHQPSCPPASGRHRWGNPQNAHTEAREGLSAVSVPATVPTGHLPCARLGPMLGRQQQETVRRQAKYTRNLINGSIT